jgi:hypothetical protein
MRDGVLSGVVSIQQLRGMSQQRPESAVNPGS